MRDTMSVAETKKHFTQILRKLGKPLTVTKRGKPVAVILSLESFMGILRRSAYERILDLRKHLSASKLTAERGHRLSRKMLVDRIQ